MRMGRRILGVSVLLLSIPAAAFAANLTWDDCVAQASRDNAELRAARDALQSSEYQVKGSYSGFFPQISGSLGYSYGTSSSSSVSSANTANLAAFSNSGSPNSFYSLSLSGTENLFNGFQDRARVAQARAARDVSSAGFETVRARVSLDLKTAFAGMVYAQRSLKLTEDIIHRREANLRQVSLRFESGRENRGSVQLSKAYLEQAKLDHLQAENALETAKTQLARALGMDEYESLSVSGDVPVSSPPEKPKLSELAIGTPEFRQAIGQEASAEAGLTLARGGFFPTLGVSATTARTGNEWFPSGNRWSVGASVTLPLFSGGKDYYATRAASETLKSSAASRENSSRQALARLKQAHSAYLEAVQKVQVDRSFSDAASTREKIAREKYNNGLLSFEDWDIIENDLIAREKSLLQSERDRVIAEATWEQAEGKGAIQ